MADFNKGNNICDILFGFLYIKSLLKRVPLLLSRGAFVFPLEWIPFQKRGKLILTELSPLKVYPFSLMDSLYSVFTHSIGTP